MVGSNFCHWQTDWLIDKHGFIGPNRVGPKNKNKSPKKTKIFEPFERKISWETFDQKFDQSTQDVKLRI